MTEETKPMTALEVQELIIGSSEKMKLLNIFNTLMQENTALKKQIEEMKNAKT
tara:strand:+ start:562 stop:720 length:159 start_codon:yes stop_codon:yes gene_type:complete